ncbi:class I SAM-dependent methyltransferase [Streptomyces indicus]|uniref:Methyltransferase domain-containing protein n=1 Tax=Streptomyces indicus TaxID=417292 RepID=A0A1G8UKD0_9ACTN|nr:class I SAM-dependent methyltransferase [Streptomyces indicus]SDJ54336.1 Methyltransferase domain-containing protein [Streptomyces indicus]
MSVTSRYKEAWEGFWRAAPEEQGAVFWDAEPALTAGLHLALAEPYLAATGLPLVDLGCGNGTQTRFLADRFPHVVGADLSQAAIDHAEHADRAAPETVGRAEYRQLDAVDKAAVQALHDELGDAHVYMRGVLHQCEPADRGPLAESIATLLGERGRAFLVELSEQAGPILMGLAQHPAGPPPKLLPVFQHGIAPAEVSDAAVPELFTAAGLAVLESGEMPLITTDFTPDGKRIELPSKWLVVGRT